jgi:hypothetical protein
MLTQAKAHMNTRVLQVVLIFLSIPLTSLADVNQRESIPDCLGSDSAGFDPGEHRDCVKDSLNVSSDARVQKEQKMLGITSNEILFVGCEAAPFKTFLARTEPSLRFKIFYRATVNSSSKDYLAPILHEVGHVYQLNRAGSMDNLFKSLDNSKERVELGADFLAGYAAHKLGLDASVSQESLSLMGSYQLKQSDPHGCPEARAAAFRFGYFYKPEDASVESQYSDFQDNLFAQTQHFCERPE